MDKGPFTVTAGDITGKIRIDSDDFTHDASLIVYGDFADDDDRIKYAEFIANELNSCAEKDAELKRQLNEIRTKDSMMEEMAEEVRRLRNDEIQLRETIQWAWLTAPSINRLTADQWCNELLQRAGFKTHAKVICGEQETAGEG